MSGFVHLHLHSEYSLLDGACRINDLVKESLNKGFKAVALTDHGNMYGCINFYKEAKSKGLKPIIGCELYVARRGHLDKTHEFDSNSYHLVLLCKNQTGYENLIKLVSTAWTKGFYNKPRVDHELLEKYNEGLIALSACLAGEIPRSLLLNDYDKAKEVALRYEKIFGKGNFYLEIQDHGLEEQQRILPMMSNLSQETGIPLVATNDCHYINREDSKLQKILLCIQTNHTLEEGAGIDFATDEFYLKTEDEMRTLFKDFEEACDNTAKIASMCNLDFEFGNTKLPRFVAPDGKDNYEYLKEQCFNGLYKYYTNNPEKEIVQRLNYELAMIHSMGYVDYYLIVNDFVQYAKSKGIPVGPGRGSGAGSIVAYCIGITGIDPIKYNLLFERFLNPERVSMPDFDIDFCYERRGEVIDYVVNKYGDNHVAQIITFGTMAARGSIRDVGRVMGLAYGAVDPVAKLIPMEIGMTINKALNVSSELKSKYENDKDIKELIDMAMKVEGMPRQAGTHAAGVVITDKPVSDYVPLAKNNDAVVTQYTMTTLEELGLLKMDFLGLRTLTVLSHAQKAVRKHNKDFSVYKIDTEDKKVYDMLSSGNTSGVFQFESAGMVRVLTQLKPENIEDLIAVISLYRPGPMDSIPKYIENRHNPNKVAYKHELLKPILDVTYGCIVYQEQVMQIFRSLGGYSLGRADIVRRAMSKKKHSVMEKERDIFINGLTDENGNIEVEGCIRRGVNREIASGIFDEMESFASYAFNKSHAAAYAFIAYQTAYMKCHYKKEFMAALLTSVLDFTPKIAAYMNECNILGIKTLPPSVNESEIEFTVVGDNIRFGLLAVKNIGYGFIVEMIKERQLNGSFTSFYDFCKRMHKKSLNKRALESLIKCGALDGFSTNRNQMLSNANKIIDKLSDTDRKNIEGQIGFFDIKVAGEEEITFEEMPELPVNEILKMEKEITGLYLTGNPLSEYEDLIQKIGCTKLVDVVQSTEGNNRFRDGNIVKLLCIIDSVKKKSTKNNSIMAFVDIEDDTSSIEMIVFPGALSEHADLFFEGNVVVVTGKVSIREDEDVKIICEHIELAKDYGNIKKMHTAKKSDNPGLYIKIPSKESKEYNSALLLLKIFDGRTPVYMYFTDSKKLFKSPVSMWVDLNDVMVGELKNKLGEENVAVRL